MLQYSSDMVEVSWIGIDLTPGLSSGTFISFSQASPSWTYVKDGLGGGIRLFNEDSSGQCQMTMEVESKTHQLLLSLALADRLTKNINAPIYLNDRSSKEKIVALGAYIIDVPDEQRATSSVPATWLFQFTSRTTIPNLFQKSAVGK